MSRFVLVFLLALGLAACQLPPERTPLKPLPADETTAVPFAELLTRARQQASNATEAFYVNKWDELEDSARGLEQTAKYLPKAKEVPDKNKDKLTAISVSLKDEAVKLREAAKKKDEKDANAALQRVHLTVRELRLE